MGDERGDLPRRNLALVPPPDSEQQIPSLVRDATDSFVSLIAAHIRLANLELAADLQAKSREIGLRIAIGLAAAFGYALLVVGVALAAVPFLGRQASFLLLGGLHLLGAGVAALLISGRRRHAMQIEGALRSVERSVSMVADAVLSPEPPHARH